MNQKLIDAVIDGIKEDVGQKDLTAVEELLKAVPEKTLFNYLPEEEWEKHKIASGCKGNNGGLHVVGVIDYQEEYSLVYEDEKEDVEENGGFKFNYCPNCGEKNE